MVGALAVMAGAAGSPLEPAAAQVDTIDWLDHSFGGGVQTVDLSPGMDLAADIVVQADGKVLDAAMANDTNTQPRSSSCASWPTVDPMPGSAPAARSSWTSWACGRGLAIQDDGRILVGGAASLGSPSPVWTPPAKSIRRSTPPTPTSGTTEGFRGEYTSLALAPDGKVVVAGSLNTATTSNCLGVVRLDPDGSFDDSFGDGGVLLRQLPAGYSNCHESVASIAVRPDGSTVVGGSLSQFSVPVSSWFRITKITPAGALDRTFGDQGTVTTDLSRGR